MKRRWQCTVLLVLVVLGSGAWAAVRQGTNFNDRYYHYTKYEETVPGLIPASTTILWSEDVWIEEITLSNRSSGDVTVTIKDRQSTPMDVLPTVSIPSNTAYGIRFGARYCPNGVTWVASDGAAVVGYVRVKK